MKVFKRLWKSLKTSYLIKFAKDSIFYNDLNDISSFSWFKVLEGDLTFICKKDINVTELHVQQYHKLYNQYIKEFGFHEDFISYLQKMKRYVEITAMYLKTGDKFYEMESDVLNAELQQMAAPSKNNENINVVGLLQKYYGFRISLIEVSAWEYYNLIKGIKQDGKANNK